MCVWCTGRNSCENMGGGDLNLSVACLSVQPSARGTGETEAWNLYCCANIAQEFFPLSKLRVEVIIREQLIISFWGHCKVWGKPSWNRCLYKCKESFTAFFSSPLGQYLCLSPFLRWYPNFNLFFSNFKYYWIRKNSFIDLSVIRACSSLPHNCRPGLLDCGTRKEATGWGKFQFKTVKYNMFWIFSLAERNSSNGKTSKGFSV